VSTLKKIITEHKIITILLSIILIIAVAIFAEYIIIIKGGSPVAAPDIPRSESSLGSGMPLKYLVMGDSTSIGQGTDYAHSFAMASAEHLAKNHMVQFLNIGISGATAGSVITDQLAKAEAYKADVVVLAVGANDVTHFTSYNSVQASIEKITSSLINANCNVKIVLTASPAMGSVPRFPFPVKQIMGHRMGQVNKHIEQVINSKQLTLAPIAARTGEAFLHNPRLFAQDKFHPNTDGYALWIPVVNEALDSALREQPSHCQM
jgi:lysophospholipase L1-like esterase